MTCLSCNKYFECMTKKEDSNYSRAGKECNGFVYEPGSDEVELMYADQEWINAPITGSR